MPLANALEISLVAPLPIPTPVLLECACVVLLLPAVEPHPSAMVLLVLNV